MRLNILIGGKAGQGINKISEIFSGVLVQQGYFTFNYRDYQSLIRGGHNFNILSVSDERIGSYESKIDGIIALDENTIKVHKNKLKKEGFILSFENFKEHGRNLNLALAGALIKIFGIDKKIIIDRIKKEFNNAEAISSAEKGYESQTKKFDFKKLNNKIKIMTGGHGIVQGAINSNIDLYMSYPMTPATGVMHELADRQIENNLMVFQPENEIAVVNAGLGASFAGAKTMIGTSGGGFDLMTEGLSMQGISEIPLVVYLASRPGPGTGIPTYSTQADLDVALWSGHGEFPRIVIAPGDPIECIEKTNEAFYLSEKFWALSIILSDKHLAESEFSSDRKPNKTLKVEIKRKVPGEGIVKASSYEHDKFGNTKEDSEIAVEGAKRRLKTYEEIKKFLKECENPKNFSEKNFGTSKTPNHKESFEVFQMIKTYGNKNSKNLIIGWGSTKTVILDAIDSIDKSIANPSKGNWKFLQILYLKPLSNEIRKEIERVEKAGGKIILIEQNVTGQLGRLIREKTGIKIQNRILKYNGRPFTSDELKEEILKIK